MRSENNSKTQSNSDQNPKPESLEEELRSNEEHPTANHHLNERKNSPTSPNRAHYMGRDHHEMFSNSSFIDLPEPNLLASGSHLEMVNIPQNKWRAKLY